MGTETFPRWTGRRLGLRPEEAPRRWLANLGLGARERLYAELDLARPRRPSNGQPPHNKSGPDAGGPNVGS